MNETFNPEKWAKETAAHLHQKLTLPKAVNIDSSPEDWECQFGDVVTVNDTRVTLDAQLTDAFVIKDGHLSRTFEDLKQLFIEPTSVQLSRAFDTAIAGNLIARLMSNPDALVGRLGDCSPKNIEKLIKSAARTLTARGASQDDRTLVLTPRVNNTYLKAGCALNEFGFGNHLMSDVLPSVKHIDCDVVFGMIHHKMMENETRSQAAIVPSYLVQRGEFAVVTGNDQPSIVDNVSHERGSTTSLTFSPQSKYETKSRAAVAVYRRCYVRGMHYAGHTGGVILEGYSADKPPQAGQVIAFREGKYRHTYVIVAAVPHAKGQTKVFLNRPLVSGLADCESAYPGPAGEFNLAFQKNAVMMVSRPLSLVPDHYGVHSFRVFHKGIWLRVAMQYDSQAGGMRVTIDSLLGLLVVDELIACLILG